MSLIDFQPLYFDDEVEEPESNNDEAMKVYESARAAGYFEKPI